MTGQSPVMTSKGVAASVAADFRALMSAFPTGVGIVTTFGADGRPRGMTCSSVCSVTLAPPTLLVSLRCGSPTLAAILDRGMFAVNLLHSDARRAAELFASGQPDRFDHVHWLRAPGHAGPELPEDAHAAAHCQVRLTHEVGDHVVIFGEVFRVWPPGDLVLPLLYGFRRYAPWPHTRRTP